MDVRVAAFVLGGLVVGCHASSAPIPEAKADEPAPEAAPAIAVVELYTSEGCSSCPPADRVLGALAASPDRRIFALSLHVDYWDDLGWPDRFASAAHTARQQAYAQAMGLRGMYTPQMIVNGTEEFTGSDRERADLAVSRALGRASQVRLAVVPRWTEPNVLAVDYQSSPAPAGAALTVAVVERHVVTHVLRGENAGKTLPHEDVVRSLTSVPLAASTGSVVVQVPATMTRSGAEVVGWIQRASTRGGLPVLGAARAALPPDP